MRIKDLAEGAISPEAAFVEAVLAQASRMEQLPLALNYAPVARMNPFRRLLYSRSAEHCFAVVPALRFEHLGLVGWAGRSVIHLHWFANVLKGVESSDEARTRIEGFQANLAAWKARGHRILWTMHNVLPHDCVVPDAEVALRKVIVAAADAIHVLSKASVEEARRYFLLPEEKVFHVPHPCYEGWYANANDRLVARLDLDAESRDFVFVLFGSIQRYKGAMDLLDAFDTLRRMRPDRSLKLVIAGKPVDRDHVEEIAARVATTPGARLIASAMEERDIQSLFNGADAVVAPYRRTLNSGVALLAATFRRPLIAPGSGGVKETYAEDPMLLYSGAEGDGLLEAMHRALEHRPDDAVFDAILAAHRPPELSSRFFVEVRQRLFPEVIP